MILIFTPSNITRFGTRDGYAYSEEVDLSATPFSELPATLITWITSQLEDGESFEQVVVEQGMDVINAAVSVTSPLGQRTFHVTSESLPVDLRDNLLATWENIRNF